MMVLMVGVMVVRQDVSAFSDGIALNLVTVPSEPCHFCELEVAYFQRWYHHVKRLLAGGSFFA